MRCIGFAHRGASADARENTLEAFALALRLGATGLESDVWLTADGAAVLDHDGVTPDGRSFRACRRAELPAHVPALAELYTELGRDFELSLDVKDPDAASEAIEVARRAGAERGSGCVTTAGEWSRPGARCPTRCAWSTRPACAHAHPARRARGAHGRARHRRAEPALERLERAARADLPRAPAASCWPGTPRTRPSLAAVLALGVDGVFSDHVASMMAALG